MDNTQYIKYKNKYVNLKNKINRAGIILIEKSYNNQKGRDEPAIILFRGQSMCADGGGRMDKEDANLKVTATRELMEESANLFRLSTNILKDNLSYTYKDRICYFVGIIGPININYFKDNIKTISQFKISESWKEVTRIHRFYISDLKNMDLNVPDHLISVTDADGNSDLIIMERTKIAIKNGLFKVLNQIQYEQLHENLNFQEGSNKFLYGTKCYQI